MDIMNLIGMPFGLENRPNRFQRLINITLGSVNENLNSHIQMMPLYAETLEEHKMKFNKL